MIEYLFALQRVQVTPRQNQRDPDIFIGPTHRPQSTNCTFRRFEDVSLTSSDALCRILAKNSKLND